MDKKDQAIEILFEGLKEIEDMAYLESIGIYQDMAKNAQERAKSVLEG